MEKIYAVKTKYVTKNSWKEEERINGEGETVTFKVRVTKQVQKTNYHGAHCKTIKKLIKAGKIHKIGKPFVVDGWTVQNYV